MWAWRSLTFFSSLQCVHKKVTFPLGRQHLWEIRIEIFLPVTELIQLLYSSQNRQSLKWMTWVQQVCISPVSWMPCSRSGSCVCRWFWGLFCLNQFEAFHEAVMHISHFLKVKIILSCYWLFLYCNSLELPCLIVLLVAVFFIIQVMLLIVGF